MSKTKPNDFSHHPLVRLEFIQRTKRIYPLTEEEIDELGKINQNLSWFMWLNSLMIGAFISFLVSVIDGSNSNFVWLLLGGSGLGILVFSILIITNRKQFKRTLNYVKPDDANYLKVNMPSELKEGEIRFQLTPVDDKPSQDQELEIPEIYVLNALYGTDRKTIDVQSVTQHLINTKGQFQVGNNLVNDDDPDYGNPKFLWLRYIKNNKTIERTIKEDEKLMISEL
ncbi:hypothetical protein [Reichenbachiella sp. MALMAid0571]|uniref:hypothetical protein n=1 Tax=Reichenbachiella sp. MALMAid0571 TaxID=3143939 RepID=UPI0032DE8EDF